MRVSFVDLRKKSADILRALNRNETVTVLYRGRPKAVMHPVSAAGQRPAPRTKDHLAFGLWADRNDLKDVAAHVLRLRKGRFSDR